jgi:fumarylacetoacetate (FAA) hydrolase
MKLLTYDTGTGPRCGVLQDDHVVDVTALLGVPQTLRDVRALLEWGHASVDQVQDALARNVVAPALPLASVRLRAPVLQPPTVRDFMIYEEHATAQGTRQRQEAWYRMPIFYFSSPLRIFGPDDTVPYPSAAAMLDYELEIGCVIGREGSNVREAEALDYIAGFCIFNDWSCRDIQRDESEVGLGPAKGKDAASSLGPWMVTTDEMAPYLRDGRLHVKCSAKVNGDFWLQDSDGGLAYHTWGAMIERASWDSRIAPGDVLGCGTVGGGSIGEAIRKGYDKARFLQPNDVVEMEVEGIGMLRNTIGPKVDDDPNYRYRAKEQPPLPERGIAKDYRYELKFNR